MDTIIIKACLNGSRGREQNPNVPWTPEEVAQEAICCYDARVSIVNSTPVTLTAASATTQSGTPRPTA